MTKLLSLGTTSFLLAGSLACGRKAEAPPAAPAQASEPQAAPTPRLELKDVRGLSFLTVPQPKVEGAWFPAEAIGDERAQAILASPVQGIVKALPTPPERRVGAGAPLVVIASPELARLKADWLTAHAKRGQAEAALAREQRLFEGGASAASEWEAAKAEATAAQAGESAARLALEARGVAPDSPGASFTLRASESGAVTVYKVMIGQGVEAGQELGSFQAAQASLARVELPLPGPETWRVGAETEARSSGGQMWKAKVEGTPSVLSQDTRRLAYRLRLSGGVLPLPGTPLEVRVPLATAMALPQSALQQVDGVWGVFVKEGEEVRFQPVRRGPELGAEVLVLEGVKPGDTVVGDGAYLLKSLILKRQSGGADND